MFLANCMSVIWSKYWIFLQISGSFHGTARLKCRIYQKKTSMEMSVCLSDIFACSQTELEFSFCYSNMPEMRTLYVMNYMLKLHNEYIGKVYHVDLHIVLQCNFGVQKQIYWIAKSHIYDCEFCNRCYRIVFILAAHIVRI